MMKHLRLGFLLTCVMASGCGGSAGQRPGPLSTTMDEAQLAAVSMDSKKDMLTKQNEFHIAKAAFQRSSEAFKNYGHEKELAENEKKKAKIETESAKTKVAAAKTNGSEESMNSAMSAMHAAQLQNDIADAHLSVAKTQSESLKSAKLLDEEKMYLAQSRFELSKAKLASSNNLQPEGFSMGAFELQTSDRESRVQKAATRHAELKNKAKAAQEKWTELKNKAQ